MSSDEAPPVPAEPARRFDASVPCFAGATSVLYEGRDPDSGAGVLVKVVRDGVISTAAERQRTLRELNKLLAIRHPALPQVFAAGEDEGRVWLAREFVEGESLGERVARTGPLPPAVAARIAAQIASALGELHRQGVLHRDVRPGHVLITPTGAVKLVDAAIGRSYKTPDGRAMTGTPGYVAPESIAGKLVSFRSDLYSLGATLFEALTGAPPYGPSDAPNVLTLQSEHDAPALRVPAPPALARLVASLLAREPRERPFSAQQLERQLEPLAFADGADVEAEQDPSQITTIGMAEMGEESPAVPPAREEFEDDPTEVGEIAMPEPMLAAAPPPSGVRPHTAPRGLPSAPSTRSPTAVTNSVIKAPPPSPLGHGAAAVASVGKPLAPSSADLARKQTLMGISPQAMGAASVSGGGGVIPSVNGSAMAAVRAPRAVPAVPELPAAEGSGSVAVPPPDDPNDFDDFVDTVVQEDSRIFGMPEVGTASPHGSAVPPLPETLAAQVLTGSSSPAFVPGAQTPNPSAFHPNTDREVQPWGAQVSPDADGRVPSHGAGLAPPQPIAAQAPPGHGPMMGPPYGGPAVQPMPGYDPRGTVSAYNAPAMGYGPSVSGGYPQQSGPYPQSGYPQYPSGQYPPQHGYPPGYAPPGYPAYAPNGSYPPGMHGHPVVPPHAYPPPRRSYWPWILAGIGIAGLAGAGGYYFATRERAPTREAPVSAASTSSAPATASAPSVPPAAQTPPAGSGAAAPPNQGATPPTQNGAPAVPTSAAGNNSSNSGSSARPSRGEGGHGSSSHSDRHDRGSRGSEPAVSAATTPASAGTADLRAAQSAINRRDYPEARAILAQLERAQPNNPGVHALKAEIALRLRDLPQAIGELRAASRLAPRNTDYLHRLADAQVAWNQRADAQATLRQILQINPRDAAAQQQLDQLAGRAGAPTPAGAGTRPATTTAPGPARPGTQPPQPAGARGGTSGTVTPRAGTTTPSGGVPMFGPAPSATPRSGTGTAVPMSTRW